MNNSARSRIGFCDLSKLLGTASMAVLAWSMPVLAQQAGPTQTAANALPEQVLVTGSLISGAQAIGVPVTVVGTKDFQDSGAITVIDVLRTIPSLTIQASQAQAAAGGNEIRTAFVDIHALNVDSGIRTLMLIDGLRYPLQNQNATKYDPTIIPELALDRIDVLADGASATYGSDSVAGVVNLILRRGFDGAITQFRVGTEDGALNTQATQLFGRTWDSGDITLTYQYWSTAAIGGKDLPFYTTNFTPWGLDNENTIKSSIPGNVSVGAPNATTGTGCTNCYSVPKGQNGVGLTWSTLLANAGTGNEINGYSIGQILNAETSSSAAATFDQRILPEVEVFGEGFYANRHVSLISAAIVTPYNTLSLVTVSVPTSNPYYPAGAPSGLRVSYNFADELTPLSTGYEISGRYSGGFNLNLPDNWLGKIFANINQEDDQFTEQNSPNVNNISAALGWTIAATPTAGATPGTVSFAKPSNVPYLNIFCDPTAFQCNSPTTLQYINAYGETVSRYALDQYGATFNGPLLALPGGEAKAAIGADYQTDNYFFETIRTRNSVAANIVQVVPDYEARKRWAAFGQLNVPIFGDANALPLLRNVELEVSYRYDHYSDFGGTGNPKIGLNWTPVEDLRLRGSWGTSFNAPTLADISPVAARSIGGTNILAGGTSNSLPLCTTIGSTPAPGSAAAVLNPTCSAALNFPGVLTVQGGTGGLAGVTRPAGYAERPETSTNWNFGFDFTPQQFLKGFDLSTTWYNVDVSNTIVALTVTNVPNILSNPAYRPAVLVRGDPSFSAALAALLATPQSTVPAASATNITAIVDSASRNLGYLKQEGLDLTANYNWDMGDLGDGNTGITGDYKFHQITALPGAAPIDTYDNNGQPLAFRLTWRSHLGWNLDGISATWFVDYTSHVSSTVPLPPAAYLANFPNYSNKVPAEFLFNVSLGYNTRTDPANTYLQNLNFQLVVNNIMNRNPPFAYNTTQGVGYLAALFNPYGREIAFTITKAW